MREDACVRTCQPDYIWSEKLKRLGIADVDHIRISAISNSQRFHPGNITEKDHYDGPGVISSGGIKLNEWTETLVFERGSVTGDCLCKKVFLPRVSRF
ncbi:hypothetical protein TNCV_445341 [Trichonephila clavipes]|nr:hypothetical protein TNCV_445341 [Trichonephila clavipes]